MEEKGVVSSNGSLAKSVVSQDFFKLVYLEQASPFGGFRVVELGEKNRAVRLGQLMRAIGVIEGVITEFDAEMGTGTIEIEGNVFPIKEEMGSKKKDFTSLVGQEARFVFWPTKEEIPKRLTKKQLPIGVLKLVRVRKVDTPSSGYVEVIGKLECIFSVGFVVAVWSKQLQRFLYVFFAGKYPYSDEVGKFVWVVGKLDFKTGWLCFEQANTIAFVPQEEAKSVLFKGRGGRGRRTVQKSVFSRRLNKFKPNVPIVELSLDKIEIPSNKKHLSFTEVSLAYLRKQYKELGRTPEPIIVKEFAPRRYLLCDGLRRFYVAKELGCSTIAAYVTKSEENERV